MYSENILSDARTYECQIYLPGIPQLLHVESCSALTIHPRPAKYCRISATLKLQSSTSWGRATHFGKTGTSHLQGRSVQRYTDRTILTGCPPTGHVVDVLQLKQYRNPFSGKFKWLSLISALQKGPPHFPSLLTPFSSHSSNSNPAPSGSRTQSENPRIPTTVSTFYPQVYCYSFHPHIKAFPSSTLTSTKPYVNFWPVEYLITKLQNSPQSQLRISPSLPDRLLVSTIHETKKTGCYQNFLTICCLRSSVLKIMNCDVLLTVHLSN